MVRVIFPMLTLMIVGCSSFAARTMNDYDQGGVSSAKFSKDSEACDKQATADQRTMGAGSIATGQPSVPASAATLSSGPSRVAG